MKYINNGIWIKASFWIIISFSLIILNWYFLYSLNLIMYILIL
jgi:hypothetical protein